MFAPDGSVSPASVLEVPRGYIRSVSADQATDMHDTCLERVSSRLVDPSAGTPS